MAKHRELESAQQDALGATCGGGQEWAAQHCAPTCYPLEPVSPRERLACQREGSATWILVDDEATPLAKKHKLKPHKRRTWQAAIETALPGFVVTGAAVRATTHPLTREPMHCVAIAERAAPGPCGSAGKPVCEASGNAAARGLNLVHYRVTEAASLHAAGNEAGCQEAALDALATARGLPRWRQYAKLNVGDWPASAAYKTRFDGVLDEDALFARAAELGATAESLHATCGGGSVNTTPQQEQAFHSCP